MVVLAAAGAVAGAWVLRSHYSRQLETLAAQQADLERKNAAYLNKADHESKRLQWIETENARLREQLEAILSGHGAEEAIQQTALPTQEEPPIDNTPPDSAPPPPASPNTSVFNPGSGGASNSTTVKPGELFIDPDIAEERLAVEDFLAMEAAQSTDPNEQQRLADIHDQLKNVRDMYAMLPNASGEERQQVLDAILQSRANLKQLVQDQRRSMVRDTLERQGVTDQNTQRQVIETLEQLEQTPYWKDTKLVWGMAAPQRDN